MMRLTTRYSTGYPVLNEEGLTLTFVVMAFNVILNDNEAAMGVAGFVLAFNALIQFATHRLTLHRKRRE